MEKNQGVEQQSTLPWGEKEHKHTHVLLTIGNKVWGRLITVYPLEFWTKQMQFLLK